MTDWLLISRKQRRVYSARKLPGIPFALWGRMAAAER
jgi:hypothetical protein